MPDESDVPASPAPPVLPPELIRPLREDLQEAPYTVEAVTTALGAVASAALVRGDRNPARRTLAADPHGPVGVLLRLFALGDAVPAADLDAACPRTGAAGLLRIGLVCPATTNGDEALQPEGVDGGGETMLRAACDLRPYGDEENTWWVASDLAEATTGAPLHPDHVLGIGGASLTLAGWTPRIPADRVADVGTGCGVQALHATAHAGEIVATDLSERALGFAAFNAALAGTTWDLRAGDLFAPLSVGGSPERFDLIVSNPPFVITPRAADLPVYEYRDGGRAGDAVVETFVRGVGEHLQPGGLACFLANWEVGEGEDWRERWRSWLDTPECRGLDAWVIAREHQDVAEYAETWTRDGGHRDGTPEYDRWVTAWLADFAERGVDRIWFGVVFLVRPESDRERWIDLTEATGPVGAPMGDSVLRGLTARTTLAGLDDDALFATAWTVAGDVTEERYGRPGASDPEVILVRQGGGLRRVVRADTALAAFLSVCDGDLTGDVAVTAIAALLAQDAVELRRRLSPVVRDLVADGLLVPAT